MSNSAPREGDGYFADEELSQIRTRCRELRKEKDILRESQSQSFQLVKQLEQHVKSLSEALAEDKKQIQKLEKELLNCTQEIEYLQDQLNARNVEVYELGYQVHELELKLADKKILEVTVCQLTEELQGSNSENFLLLQKLQSKEMELQRSALSVEKLEESISVLTLDSQCEIESMKLDMMSLEQACKDDKRVQEVFIQEKARMREFIKELEAQLQDSEKIRKDVEKENRQLREKLATSDRNLSFIARKIEAWLEDNNTSLLSTWYSSELDTTSTIAKERKTHGWDLGPDFSELAVVLAPALNLKEQVSNISQEISKYEGLVMQLKEELREEKLKAKEEAEDLAQEMAELRYRMTGLLEEECKRRAFIEQASLQRIAELEAQIHKEQQNGITAIRCLPEE